MRRRVAICMPMLAPYAVPRFEALAQDERLDVALFVESQGLAHRPGWTQSEVAGCAVEQVASLEMWARPENAGLGYTVSGVRLVPYGLVQALRRFRPEVVLACNATELAVVLPWRRAYGYRVGLLVEDTEHTSRHKSAFSRLIRRHLYRAADFFMPFGEDSHTYLSGLGIQDHISRTSWSVDGKRFAGQRDLAKVASIRGSLGVDHRVLFLTVAQLIPRKGVADLLLAWKGLSSELHSQVALAIVGNGSQYADLAEYIAAEALENVHLVGHRDYEDVIDYYNASDVFVLPTLKDHFSLSVMEAMACGLPVITTIYNGARELVVDDVNGYVVDPRDSAQMCAAILSLADRERVARFGRASAERIEEFSHKEVMRRFADVLASA